MKKLIAILHWAALLLTFLTPVGSLLSVLFAYRFCLADYKLYAVLMAVVFAANTTLSLIFRDVKAGKVLSVLMLPLPAIIVVNWFLFVIQCEMDQIIVICLLACLACACYLTIRYGKEVLLAAICIIAAAVMLFPVLGFTFLELFIGGLSQKTVVETIYSPGCSYYAQVIDDDQGALGGATHVYIYENSGVDLGIFRTEKIPQKIYYGNWGTYVNMTICWKSDNCLVIDGEEYLVE